MEIKNLISQTEYDIYTAVCQQTNLFLFHQPDTIFNDHTADEQFHIINNTPRFGGAFKYKVVRRKGLIEDYEVKNARQWTLEKRFYFKNGYCFVSELTHQQTDKPCGVFTLSRVGLSASLDDALVHIAYSICGYYLLFHLNGSNWEQVGYLMSYCV
ncbi:hypothetical protein H6G04_26815 [Calothrix membranacea FACHB-236]|nr:hypothetical protein [Calothrix membranacea FACHB-236]